MSNELNIGIAISGLDVSAIPFKDGVSQTPIALTEIGSYGVYQGDMSGTAGIYTIIFTYVDGLNTGTCGSGKIIWDGAAEIEQNPTAAVIADELLAKAQITPIYCNTKQIADIYVGGLGTTENPWGPL